MAVQLAQVFTSTNFLVTSFFGAVPWQQQHQQLQQPGATPVLQLAEIVQASFG